MADVKLNSLSEEQRAALKAELKAEEKAATDAKKEEEKMYRELRNDEVNKIIPKLQNLSTELSLKKAFVFGGLESLLKLKAELFEVKSGQQSHTFSNTTKDARVTIGFRQIDRFDDTVDEGIALVREYVDSLARDEKSAKLVGFINGLLKRDKKNNLDARRVVDLQKLANEEEDDKLNRGVEIIVKAKQTERSAYFVTAEVKTAAGTWQNIPLSISAVNFPEGFEFNL